MGSLREIIRAAVSTEIRKLWVRCRGCGHFFHKDAVEIAACGCCYQGVFAFCGGPKCGGPGRAQRSLQAHVRYFASRRGVRYGNEHRDLWIAYLRR